MKQTNLLEMANPYESGFVYHDFSREKNHRTSAVKPNRMRLYNTSKNRSIYLNRELSDILYNKKTTMLLCREDRYTGVVDIIFNREHGIKSQNISNRKSNIMYGSKDAVVYIANKVAGVSCDFHLLDIEAKIIANTDTEVVVRLSNANQTFIQ